MDVKGLGFQIKVLGLKGLGLYSIHSFKESSCSLDSSSW